MQTRFSVIIPVHNRAEVIGRAVSSVLAQTFASFEVIVVDDGSTDESVASARAVADSRVRILRQTESGLDIARYAGSTKARGRWVTFLNPDDEVRSDWLSRLGKLIDANNAALVSCGGHERYLDASTFEILPQRIGFPGGSAVVSIRSGAFAVERRFLQSLPYWNDPSTRGSFASLAIHLINEVRAGSGEIVSTPEPLVTWNEPAQDAQYHGDELRLRLALQAIDSLAQTPIPDGELLCRYATIGGVAASRLRQHKLARHLFQIALRSMPEHRKLWARYLVSCVPFLARRVWKPSEDSNDHSPSSSVTTTPNANTASSLASHTATSAATLLESTSLDDDSSQESNPSPLFKKRTVLAASTGAEPPVGELNGHPSQGPSSSVQLLGPIIVSTEDDKRR